jgi:membrane associated rhomboid family serine protease
MRYRGFGITAVWVLIGINLVLFIATSINKDLIWFLGLQPAGLLDRPWTLVTNLFIHANIGHILANMVTLFFFGSFFCRLVGVRNFLITYFVGGMLGNILFILLAPSSYSIAIGASGAIYALAGALVVMMPSLRVLLFFVFPMPLWVVVLLFFVFWSFIPGIAWQGHLGGLVFGLAMGFFLRRRGRYYYY